MSQTKILEFLKKKNRWYDIEEISKGSGVSRSKTGYYLRCLKRKSQVQRRMMPNPKHGEPGQTINIPYWKIKDGRKKLNESSIHW